MNNTTRILLYFLVCIPVRLLIPYLIYKYFSVKNYKYFALPIGLISFGFLYLYFFNQRLNAREGGKITWWHDLRLVHGLLYLCALIYIIKKNKIAYLPLLLDILVGFWGYKYLRKK
tara:strand:- start:155 stop:502 length:348 start_codon:yes stop_codon:yes gene_type:complete